MGTQSPNHYPRWISLRIVAFVTCKAECSLTSQPFARDAIAISLQPMPNARTSCLDEALRFLPGPEVAAVIQCRARDVRASSFISFMRKQTLTPIRANPGRQGQVSRFWSFLGFCGERSFWCLSRSHACSTFPHSLLRANAKPPLTPHCVCVNGLRLAYLALSHSLSRHYRMLPGAGQGFELGSM